MISTVPTAWVGTVQVIVVGLTTVIFVVGEPPMMTDAPGTNPVPVIVMGVVALAGPNEGGTAVTDGGAVTSNTILLPMVSVNHRLPSAPRAMPVGWMDAVGMVNSVIVPL